MHGLMLCLMVTIGLTVSSAAVADGLAGWGVVLIHGKRGVTGNLASLASGLSADGAAVVQPTMSWTSRYRTYDETLSEIGSHVAALRGKGAKRIALVGHSLGANVALGFGAQRGGVDVIVALAPGHQPDRFAARTADSLARAKALVAAGRGGELATFRDVNQGDAFDIRTTAAAYVSFFDPAGPALMARNAAGLKGAKLLWVVGTGDPGARAVARGGEIVTVQAGHGNTPSVGTSKVVAWLKAR
jgi:alpha-beta hydrolase superfamily lysophospholipase